MAQIQTRNDPVEHPNYYNWIPKVECLDVVECFNFNLGCAVKYIWRAPTKMTNEKVEDLRKAVFYLEREMLRLQPNNDTDADIDLSYFEGLNRKAVEAVDYGPNTHRGGKE